MVIRGKKAPITHFRHICTKLAPATEEKKTPSRPSSPLGRSLTKLYGKVSSRFPKGKKESKETAAKEEAAPAATEETADEPTPATEEAAAPTTTEEEAPAAAPVESAPVVTASA
jgi:hypothetical protein